MPAWSLILFTLVIQACVGGMVCLELLRVPAAGRKSEGLPDGVRSNTMIGITIGTAAAVVVSIFHLGSPIKAVFAMNNLGSSWLSREILLLLLFGGSVALATAMWRRGWGSEASRVFFARLSALLGLVLIYVMARVYMLPTTPSWDTAATAISFCVTSLVLGGGAVLAGLVSTRSAASTQSETPAVGERPVRVLMWALMIGLGVEILLTPFQAGVLYQHPLVVDHGDHFALLSTLLGVRVLSAAVAIGFLIKLRSVSIQRPAPWLLTTLALILFAEVLGRYTFYAFYYRIGV